MKNPFEGAPKQDPAPKKDEKKKSRGGILGAALAAGIQALNPSPAPAAETEIRPTPISTNIEGKSGAGEDRGSEGEGGDASGKEKGSGDGGSSGNGDGDDFGDGFGGDGGGPTAPDARNR